MRNLKKVVAFIAVFALVLTTLSTVAFAQTYPDVAEGADYYEAIEMLSSLKILTGDDNDGDGVYDFRPNDGITRAEVAVIISRIQNINNVAQAATQFVDVPSSHWASGYVAQAAGQGIVNGYGDGNFGPEDPVLYEQVVKMLMVTLGYEPMAADNGGYPTGYLTAAQRAGVVNGVVGAAVETKATRGQVAQMVYNALDTPLMDRYTYGKDAEYVIYDGKNDRDYSSLLTRDLKVKKFSGVVIGNRLSDIGGTINNTIDKEDEEEITILADKNDSYKNYDVEDITGVEYDLAPAATSNVYAGDSDAADFLGKHVNVYVKEDENSSNKYYIISIAESNRNKTLSFNFDQFDYLDDGNGIYYFKNVNDRNSVLAKLEDAKHVSVIFNGVVSNDGVNEWFSTKTATGKIEKDSTFSGRVTLVDNDTVNGYNVVIIESGAPAVVDEVSSTGRVKFKEAAKNIENDTVNNIDFYEGNDDVITKLTKDGKEISYDELKEWDVVSVFFSGNIEYYDVRVVGSNAIDGSVSSRTASTKSADGYKYTINGQTYNVAQNAYGTKTNGWNPGTSGVFYVDEFGKIVAYDKDGSTAGSGSDNYAYVLNAVVDEDAWEKENVRVQILDKSGKIFEGYLASTVKFENVAGKGIEYTDGSDLDEDASVKIEKLKADTIVDALINNLITYSANSASEMKTITFAQNDEDDNSLYLAKAGVISEYDLEDKELKLTSGSFELDESTVVFFVKGEDKDKKITYDDASVIGSKTASKVGTIASIGGVKGKDAVIFDARDDAAGAVVILNTSGGVSSSAPIAVVDSIGTASVSGDTVEAVTFFMNGEKMQAYTDADIDYDGKYELDSDDYYTGDLWKFTLSADGSTIIGAECIAKANDVDTRKVPGKDGEFVLNYMATEFDDDLVSAYYGPVFDYTSGKIRIAGGKAGAWNFDNKVGIKTGKANVYVYDPVRSNNLIYVGDASDVNYDRDVIQKNGASITFKKYPDLKVAGDEEAYGMMDFVYAIEYDGDVTDIVIYKAYDFGRYVIDDVKPL